MADVIDLTVMSEFSYFNSPILSGTVFALIGDEIQEVTKPCHDNSLGDSLGTKRARSTEPPLPAKKRTRLDVFLDPNGSMEDDEPSSDSDNEEEDDEEEDNEEEDNEVEDDLDDALVFDSVVFDSDAARLVKGGMPLSVAKSFARRTCRLPDYDRGTLLRIMARMEVAKKPLSAALHEEFLKELHYREACQSDEEESAESGQDEHSEESTVVEDE